MNTVNNGIPFVPENTIDQAAGMNLSLNTIDALMQVLVVSVGANTPPASPVNGARYIVGTLPTGAWAGQANRLARWLDGAWQFFDARYALNQDDGQWYGRSGAAWAQLGGALADGSVTNPKLANMATGTIKGRASAATGAPEDLTPAQARNILAVREQLTSDRTYFVRTDGDNSNNGLTNTAGGAFLTIQRAVDAAASIDSGNYQTTIKVADGTYGQAVVVGALVGSKPLIISGNETTPSNVLSSGPDFHITTTHPSAYIAVSGITFSGGVVHLSANPAGIIEYKNVRFLTATSRHVNASLRGVVVAAGSYEIAGGAQYHVQAIQCGSVRLGTLGQTTAITLTGTPNFSIAFVDARNGPSLILTASVTGQPTFIGSATGPRYSASTNSVISVNGAGVNYFPGDAAGTTATGGLYV